MSDPLNPDPCPRRDPHLRHRWYRVVNNDWALRCPGIPAPAVPVGVQPEPAEEAAERVGAEFIRRIAEANAAVPVVHPEPGDRPVDPELERLCVIMHDAYEDAAHANGWESQVGAIPWVEVPEANKATMRVAVAAAVAAVRADTAALDLAIQQTLGAGLLDCEFHGVDWHEDCDQCAYWEPAARAFQAFRAERRS